MNTQVLVAAGAGLSTDTRYVLFSYKGDGVSISQTGKLKLREAKKLAQGHMCHKWKDYPAPKPMPLTSALN